MTITPQTTAAEIEAILLPRFAWTMTGFHGRVLVTQHDRDDLTDRHGEGETIIAALNAALESRSSA